jgi:hypothetical protein
MMCALMEKEDSNIPKYIDEQEEMDVERALEYERLIKLEIKAEKGKCHPQILAKIRQNRKRIAELTAQAFAKFAKPGDKCIEDIVGLTRSNPAKTMTLLK